MERAGRIAGKLKLSTADGETRARACWSLAAGKKIAEHTRPVSLVRTTLVVEVDDIVWQRQLNSLRKILIGNLAREMGEELVTDIDFRPVPKKRGPQVAQAARPKAALGEADRIDDPFLRRMYRESEAKVKKQA